MGERDEQEHFILVLFLFATIKSLRPCECLLTEALC